MSLRPSALNAGLKLPHRSSSLITETPCSLSASGPGIVSARSKSTFVICASHTCHVISRLVFFVLVSCSTGLRVFTNCAGRPQDLCTSPLTPFGPCSLAYVEMRIIMAKILWNFDLTLMDVSRDWTDQKSYLIWAKHPLMVKLSPVNRDLVAAKPDSWLKK